jgi:hypothetical protein
MLSLGDDAFETHFTCEKNSAPFLVISSEGDNTVDLAHFIDAILHRLNGLEERLIILEKW